ncbi:hypothetical protein B0H12DRAFT_377181 [Mycena haematopus]|nr:hypothetical protein B0H12DRAFT_377181 [Mycena haematopus]
MNGTFPAPLLFFSHAGASARFRPSFFVHLSCGIPVAAFACVHLFAPIFLSSMPSHSRTADLPSFPRTSPGSSTTSRGPPNGAQPPRLASSFPPPTKPTPSSSPSTSGIGRRSWGGGSAISISFGLGGVMGILGGGGIEMTTRRGREARRI